jgi:sRNA-binding regulator protein Hfq
MKAENAKKYKEKQGRDELAEKFLSRKQGEESPTSMKMKNSFLLKNNNHSFDEYAAMMKKRKVPLA